MVYKEGAFVAGQLQIVVNAGRKARSRLRNHEYSSEEERQELLQTVRQTRGFEEMLEAHKKRYGL